MGPEAFRLSDEQVSRRLKERRVTVRTTWLELARFLNVPKEHIERRETGDTVGSGTVSGL